MASATVIQRLKVGVVGCGIAGLSAAIALSRAGHEVEVYEQSKFRDETGAGIIIGPNGSRILRKWGFDFEAAGALDFNQTRRLQADTLEVHSEEYFTDIKQKYGDRWLLFHRADLHSGLKSIAQGRESCTIRLGEKVEDTNVDNGSIVLSDGTQVQKDLVIIADGAHSELIAKVIGHECPVTKSPMSMYRFLQPMKEILKNQKAGGFFRDQPSGFTTFYKTEVGRPGLLLNTYPVRHGELLYAALVHPTKPKEKGLKGWDSPADAQDVITDAEGFHLDVQAICKDATEVKVYTQMWRDPLERLTRGRAVLVGDAGHLMLPTHGQGAAMAIEDAMAMEVLFEDMTDAGEIASRLKTFQVLRQPRVSAVQTMSNKMMGPPDKMASEVRRYWAGPIPTPGSKTFGHEYNDFFFRYDVAEEAKAMMDGSR